MGKFKTLKFAAELAILAIIYSSFLGAAYADINTWKPLNTWAQTQIIVFNSDLDDKIHFEVWYSLDELWANVTADPSIQLGLSNEYKNRYRAPEPRADFTANDINEMLRVGYVFEVMEDTVKIYWSDRALNLHVDGNPDLPLLEDLNQDPTGVFQSLTLDNPALWVNRHKVANDKHAIHEITYFHIYMWKMSPPPEKVVDGELGEGGQIMGDPWLRYYWGLLTNEQSTAVHTWLTVPEADYGPGTYCAVVKTRLGLWDYSYYDYWMYDPQHGIYGPQFEVERFYSALPTARGTIRNPGSDSIIVIDIPAYSDFSPPSSTDDGLPPSFYMIEISESSSFPWSEPPESPRKTVYAYPEAKDEPMSIYLSVDSLDHGVDKFYGRIGCVGPAGQYWTDGPKALLGPNADGSFNVYYWTTRLPAVTDFNVTNPGEDTTLQITITRPKYSDFIAIAQAATPTVNIYLVHDNIYSTYSSNQEKIMEVIYDPGHAHYSKIKTIPVDIVNQATPIKVNAEVPFEATGIYHVCARSSADGFTPGEFSGWQSTNIQVDQDHLTTQLATIPEDKWSVDNTGEDAYISVSINHYSEFIGTKDMHSAYEVKVIDKKGTPTDPSDDITGYAYVSVVEEAGEPTIAYINLRKVDDGKGGYIDFVPTKPKTLYFNVRCVAEGRTPGAYSPSDKSAIISYNTTRLPAVTDFNVTNTNESPILNITITSPTYDDFIAAAQTAGPEVHFYLVHDNIYDKYDDDQEAIMAVVYDKDHADFEKIYVIPVDIPETVQEPPLSVTALVPIPRDREDLKGIYHICARTSVIGFTPGEFSAWQDTNIDIQNLESPLADIPADKWSVDNTGGDSVINVIFNHYSEFIGTSDMHDAYEVKVTNKMGTDGDPKDDRIGYAYVGVVRNTGQPTVAYINLTDMRDGGGEPINLVPSAAVTLYVDVRCVADGVLPGDYSGEKELDISKVSRLKNPPLDKVAVTNEGEDRVITIIVENYDADGLPASALHSKDVRHTGYEIDIAKDAEFKWDETYHFYYIYDFEGDGTADEIKGSNPVPVRVDLDLNLAKDALTPDFIEAGGTVSVRVLAIRDGYAVNYEDLPIPARSVAFSNVTRLENPNPNYRVEVYNSERGSPYEKMDTTITVEVENYDPVNLGQSVPDSVMHKKDTPHMGYQIDISGSAGFPENATYHHYYTYDDYKTAEAPDPITSSMEEDIKIHIDLNVCRNIWPMAPPGGYPTMHVRVLALRPGYAVNYEDLPAEPLRATFLDRVLLTPPVSITVSNPKNPNSIPANDIDSSIFVEIDPVTPLVADIPHEGYAVEVRLTALDGKAHSNTFYITGLVPLPDDNQATGGKKGDIDYNKHTLDVKQGFEFKYADLLENFIGVPANSIKDITVHVKSIKPGYTSSSFVDAVCPDGTLYFKNTADTFIPDVSSITATSPDGTPSIKIELGPYPSTPSTIPPFDAEDMMYQIDYSTDPSFPWDPPATVTWSDYDVNVAAPGGGDTVSTKDVTGLLVNLEPGEPKIIYVRARLLKDGYTPGLYTTAPPVEVAVMPPIIQDFTADPTVASILFGDVTVTFTCIPAAGSGPITEYSWNFGDSPTPPDPVSQPTIEHIYSYNPDKIGIYTITLQVEGPAGIDTMSKRDYVKICDFAVSVELDPTIQGTIDLAGEFYKSIFIPNGTYTEDVTVGTGKYLIGESKAGTIIKGNVLLKDNYALIRDLTIEGDVILENADFSLKNLLIKGNVLLKDSDSTIEDATIRYDKGEEFTYSKAPYSDFRMVSAAGITAINSEITVKNCLIMPDPDVHGSKKYGKGVQIWHLSGSQDIAPVIANSLILYTDAAIYLYSHPDGGSFTTPTASGYIGYNTLDRNNYGIVIRTPTATSDPVISSNIITNSIDAIHISYYSHAIMNERMNEKIVYNCFYGNEHDVFCDERQTDFADFTGYNYRLSNINEDPEYVHPYAPPSLVLDYYPDNPDCYYIGIQGAMRGEE